MNVQQSRFPLDDLSSLSPFGVAEDRPRPMRPAQHEHLHQPGTASSANTSQQLHPAITHNSVRRTANPAARSATEHACPCPSQPRSHPNHDTCPLPPPQPPTSAAATGNTNQVSPYVTATSTCAVPQLGGAPTPPGAPSSQSGRQLQIYPLHTSVPHTSHNPFDLLALDTSHAHSVPNTHSASPTVAAQHATYGSSPRPQSYVVIQPATPAPAAAATAAAAAPSAPPSATVPSAAAPAPTCRNLLDDTPPAGYPAPGPAPFHPAPDRNPAQAHHHPNLPSQPQAATPTQPPTHTAASGQAPPPHGHYPLHHPATNSPTSTAAARVASLAATPLYGHPAASPYAPPYPYHAACMSSNSISSSSHYAPTGPARFYSPAAHTLPGAFPATAPPYSAAPAGFGHPPHAPHPAYYSSHSNISSSSTNPSGSGSSSTTKPGGDAPLSLIAAKSLGGVAVVALQRSALAMGKFAGKLEKGVAKLQEKEAKRQEKRKGKY